MLKEFKNFILRGNVMDLAVAVIIGAAFNQIVTSLTTNIINPILSLVLGQVDLSNIILTIGPAQFRIGSFLNDVINFIVIAFVIFMILRTINHFKHEKPAEPVAPSNEEIYLKEIRDALVKKSEA